MLAKSHIVWDLHMPSRATIDHRLRRNRATVPVAFAPGER
jgi:hypothetical protein